MWKIPQQAWSQIAPCYHGRVAEEWIDSMGHMNVMWYTYLFSHGTMAFFRSLGLTKEYFVANQAGSFVLEQHVRYLSEVRVGESVSVRVRALGRSERRLHVLGMLVKEDSGVLAATYEGVTAHIDMTQRRTSPYAESIRQAYDEVLAKHQALDWDPPVNGVTRPF